ncbi:MAG: PAS domain S-box protein, partial [Chthoniobacterales bacterium]
PGEGISGWVALHGEPIRTADVKREPRYIEADPAIQSELCVPLKVGGRTIGSLNVESDLRDAFSEHDEQLLTTLANQAAIAIENARLFHKLESDLNEHKRTEEELRASKRRLSDIFTFAPVGIYQSTREGTFITANNALAEMLGYSSVEELLKVKIATGIYFEENERQRLIKQYEDRGYGVDLDLLWKRKDGSPIPVQMTAHAIKRPDGGTEYFEGFVRDITEHKKAEAALRGKTERLLKVQQVARMGLLDWNLITDELMMSEEARRIYGFEESDVETSAELLIRAVHPDDVARVRENLEATLRGERPYDIEHRLVRPDGVMIWSHSQAELFRDAEGKPRTLLGTTVDITKRKQVESELKKSREELRGLLARLHRAREEERIRVSREVHDELGQLLTGLKMDVRWLERKLSEPGLAPKFSPLLDRVVAASELVEATIGVVQKIAAELRPDALDALGLEPALQAEARRFQERSGLRCTMVAQKTRAKPSPEIANELFYICQEAMTNIARHARATCVEIHLQTEGDAIVLEVCDDGAGISAAKLKAPHSLGLIGMRERALQCGGTIAFSRNQPHGTRVTVRVPGSAQAGGAGS